MAKYENYKGRAKSGEFAKSRTKGTVYVSVICECLGDDGKPLRNGLGEPVQYEYQGYFTELTSERTIASLRLMGCTFPGDDLTNLAGLGSKTVEIQVEDTDYGKRVAWVNPPTVGSVDEKNKMDNAAKKNFAASMRGTLAALKKGANGKSISTPDRNKDWTPPPAAAPANDSAPVSETSPATNTAPPAEELPAQGTGTDDDIPF